MTDPEPARGAEERQRFRISGISVVAGAAAAATAALATSALGVAGTVLGAAAVSAMMTVAAAIYDHSLRQAKVRLADRLEATARLPLARPDGTGDPRETPTADLAASTAAGAEPSATRLPLDALDLEDERGYHWRRIAAVSVLVFALAMGAITAFELVTGRPLSSLITGSDTGGTTVGTIVRRPHRSSTPTPAPTPTTPAPSPSPSPTGTSPTPTPTPTGTSPSPRPTSTSPSPSPSGTAATPSALVSVPVPGSTPTPSATAPSHRRQAGAG